MLGLVKKLFAAVALGANRTRRSLVGRKGMSAADALSVCDDGAAVAAVEADFA